MAIDLAYLKSPWVYQLKYKLRMSDTEQAEAYKEMQRFGRWLENMYWQPKGECAHVAVEIAGREGFNVMDTKAADL